MDINKEELNRAIEEVQTGKFTKRLTTYSSKATPPIRYTDIRTPLFSMSAAAAELIEEQIKKDYPELYQHTVDVFGEPRPSKSAKNVKSTDMINLNLQIAAMAKTEAATPSGKTLAIWNERIAVVIRYFMLTTPRYSMSKELAALLEKRITSIHPGIWDAFSKVKV